MPYVPSGSTRPRRRRRRRREKEEEEENVPTKLKYITY
jgi:hypothetical protein